MIGLYASGATASLVAKIRTKKKIPLPLIKSFKKLKSISFIKHTPKSENSDSKYNFEVLKN